LSSPAQLKSFFLKKGYRIGINRETGQPKLDKDDMAMLAMKYPDDESVSLITRIRKDQDFDNDTLGMRLDPSGKVHSHWKQTGTNGLRWSGAESILGYSSKTKQGYGRNLQNLDRQGVARSLFLPA
jgi:hypothetical protein